MKQIGKTAIFGVLALALALGAFGLLQPRLATAIEPGVYPVPGNPSCATLNADPFFDNITSDFGFKINGVPTQLDPGTGLPKYYFTSTYGELTGGAPSDANNYVAFPYIMNPYFDWVASLGIDAVIVKGGPNADAYVYVPEAYQGQYLSPPINPETGQPYGISHIEFCYDYELTAEKTADAKYTRTYTWEINKVYDGEYWRFIGEPATTHGYEVSVDQIVTDSDFQVTGEITINNPTPFEVGFSVSDFVDGTSATVTCPDDDYMLDPGETKVCSYVAELGDTLPPDGTNTATITSLNGYVYGATAAADYAFGDPTTVVGHPDINVTDTNGGSWSASGDASWTYTRDFVCPTDTSLYVNGVYSFDHENTATIVETGQSDNAMVTINCYAPVPSKAANTSYTRTYTWNIAKDYNGEYWKFIGDPATTHGYEVSVDQTVTDSAFAVAGTITVKNYNPESAMTVSLEDYVDSTMATLDCGGSLVVPAATDTGPGEATCGYSAGLGDTLPPDGTNTATVTLNNIDFDATAGYAFGDPTTVVGHPDINVTDTNGGSWSASGDASWTYTRDFVCPTDTSLYVNGVYSFDHENTATIVETGQSDNAMVTVNCYAPVPSKTAAGTYDERHEWDVDKTVTPLTQGGYPGDLLGWTWTVNVTEDVYEENFAVAGTIAVKNYNPESAMSVSLEDYVDSTMATLDCGGSLVVPAATDTGPGEATCGYSASFPAIADDANAPQLNTATVTLNNIGFYASASIEYTANRIRENATLTDDEIGLNESLAGNTQAGTYTFGPYTGSDSHTCSTLKADYFVGGVYTQGSWEITNWAYVYSDGEEQDRDDATTTYTCDAGFMDLLKLTDGLVDPSMTWSFALYAGPDGFGSDPIGSSSTVGDPDGVLEFGGPALRPDTTYTVCELEVPSGWASIWTVNGTVVMPYNPDYDPDPEVSQDLGNRCFDFGAGTSYPVEVGQTLHFQIDNYFPGGEPRTPGYWKNWNTCTSGNQQYTATNNSDDINENGVIEGWERVASGWALLDDILNDPGVTWGGFTITTCEDGVSILDQRDLNTGKKMASDAAYTLAMHLLAARLNLAAGAESCQAALAAADAGQALLESIGFDGTGKYLRPKQQQYQDALELANILDQYNNGYLCGP